MLNKKIEKALNKQINEEFYSAYLYLSMSSYVNTLNLSGFVNWMKIQYEEEQYHAMKLYDYMIERDAVVKLEKIEKPKHQWKNIIDVFKEVLAHEQKITAQINDLMSLAITEKDHATANMLQWFVDEQVEEEASVSDILGQLKLIEGKGSGLFLLDREAKQRVFTPEN